MERVMGIEPTRLAWKARALPLSYTRPVSIIEFVGFSANTNYTKKHFGSQNVIIVFAGIFKGLYFVKVRFFDWWLFRVD